MRDLRILTEAGPSRLVGMLALGLGLLALLTVPATPAAAQELKVHAYTLKHQPVHEAVSLIRPLLSRRGTVEEQPDRNTLVLRDTAMAIGRILPILREFDHIPKDLRFEIQILRAGPKPKAPAKAQAASAAPDLPAGVVDRLRKMLVYEDYEILAEAGMTSKEGQEITYSLGETYEVNFRPGTVLAGRRVKLEDFQVLKQRKNPTNKGRRLEPKEFLKATFNVWLERPHALVLAQDDERQEALVVVVHCRQEEGAEEPAEEP